MILIASLHALYFKLLRQKVSETVLETVLGTQSYISCINIYNMTYSTTYYHIEITYKNHDIKNNSHLYNFTIFLAIYR